MAIWEQEVIPDDSSRVAFDGIPQINAGPVVGDCEARDYANGTCSSSFEVCGFEVRPTVIIVPRRFYWGIIDVLTSGSTSSSSTSLGTHLKHAAQGAAAVGFTAAHHNTMLSNLCGDDTDSPERNLDGISKYGRNKLKRHLCNISQKPCCVCFNCGMLVYYKPVGSNNCEYFVPGINRKDECRAYRVFKVFH